jgi:hypothetical protein
MTNQGITKLCRMYDEHLAGAGDAERANTAALEPGTFEILRHLRSGVRLRIFRASGETFR